MPTRLLPEFQPFLCVAGWHSTPVFLLHRARLACDQLPCFFVLVEGLAETVMDQYRCVLSFMFLCSAHSSADLQGLTECPLIRCDTIDAL
mmetsp:Transcript_10655/g.25332  ORF Transcript_10655/g.25332 Transcript_10655/m.25332 type:complete len:90 (+) Transcript_10655:1623-1892(+)